MTFVNYFCFKPPKLGHLSAPIEVLPSNVSVVVPVRDNQAGVDLFLAELIRTHDTSSLPGEVIVVDNASLEPLRIHGKFMDRGVSIRLLSCSRPGPAAARNAGAKVATSDWILFTDSDCIPTANFISGYLTDMCGSIAYSGRIQARGSGWLARYYESQGILEPPPDEFKRPLHLITANSLVWRFAFEAVGGFDERFPEAAGEDVDLGLRLRQYGDLAYAPSAIHHDFGENIRGFMKRFVRYGRGNRRLSLKWEVDLAPRVFSPKVPTSSNWFAAILQFLCLLVGYSLCRRPRMSGEAPTGHLCDQPGESTPGQRPNHDEVQEGRRSVKGASATDPITSSVRR